MITLDDARFCQSAVRCEFVDRQAIRKARDTQARERKSGSAPRPISRILIDRGHLSEGRARLIEAAERLKKRHPGATMRVGRWTVTGRIAQGGMGSVVQAVDRRSGRVAALKLLIRNSNPVARNRFLREARVALHLHHPNVVKGFEAGRDGDVAYYAMEYVPGETLGNRIDRKGPLAEREALQIGVQVARALEGIRQANLIHRDVKPDNIIITPDGTVKLCDLGLARPILGKSNVTEHGMTLGTPTYISPEQARGRRDLDSRSDIYSLGVTLFHALAGRPPHVGASAGEVISKHITEDVPALRTVRTGISIVTEAVILKMTRNGRRDRHLTPSVVERDLWLALAHACT